jgi:hypothetical protein
MALRERCEMQKLNITWQGRTFRVEEYSPTQETVGFGSKIFRLNNKEGVFFLGEHRFMEVIKTIDGFRLRFLRILGWV